MGRYVRIKSQTNVAVSWLVENARAHGCEVHFSGGSKPSARLPTDPSPPVKQGRLKGKARKEAKKALHATAPASIAVTPKDDTVAYEVSTGELLRQARYLSGLGDSFIMPKRIWRAFKEAIKGRQIHADRFATEQPEHEENHGHVYFLDIVQTLVATLQHCVDVQTVVMEDRQALEVDAIPLSNLFASLGVKEDPPEEHGPNYHAPANQGVECELQDHIQSGDATADQAPRFEPKIDPGEEDRIHWFCFVDDMNEIIKHVLDIWKNHWSGLAGAPTLWATTFLTEAALEQVLTLEEAVTGKIKILPAFLRDAKHVNKAWFETFHTLELIHKALAENETYPLKVARMTKRFGESFGTRLSAHHRDVVDGDTFLIQYVMELKVERTVRVKEYIGDAKAQDCTHFLSRNSLDEISAFLLPTAYGRDLSATGIITVNLLQRLWLLSNSHIGDSCREMEVVADTIVTDIETLNEQGVKVSAVDAAGELSTLMCFLQSKPTQYSRYCLMRYIKQEDPNADLCGQHRDMWNDLDMSLTDKEKVIKLGDGVPDHAGNAEARRRYAEQFVMPHKDSNFLRDNNPALAGKQLLNALVLREEMRLAFASYD